MQHRHLNVEPGRWSIAVVDSILERGGSSDVWALLDELHRDPHGDAAQAAEAAIATSQVYGYPQLIAACLEKWRRG